jgi:hypothetical protein
MTKNITFSENDVAVMIINDSKENILFKQFKEPRHIYEDLEELSNPDVYEDISLGVLFYLTLIV